jgi:hypothetical protein
VWVTIASFTGAILFVYAPWYALAPIISRDHYGGVGVFGLLESAAGVGAVLGGVTAFKWRPAQPLYTGLILILVWPVMAAALALTAPTVIVTALAFGTGIGFSMCIIWWEIALARHIPPSALGRVSSYDWMGSLALLPIGYLLAGPLSSVFGAREVLGVGSIVGLALLLLALAPRETRTLGP